MGIRSGLHGAIGQWPIGEDDRRIGVKDMPFVRGKYSDDTISFK